MRIIDSMITDRTQEDVTRRAELAAIAYEAMTEAEKAEWDSNLKGAYNALDLNRVSEAAIWLWMRLQWHGNRGNPISVRTNWANTDIPTQQEAENYIGAVHNIFDVLDLLAAVPSPPASTDGLTFQGANNIERGFEMINDEIERLETGWFYTGDIFCNEVTP